MFHANGWTFVWIVTAVGGDARLPAQGRSARDLRADRARARHDALRRADGADRHRQRAGRGCGAARAHGVRVLTAGAPPAAATIERVEGELGWDITHVYGLTETSPFITVCEPRPEHDGARRPRERAVIKARQGVELITSGELRVVDEEGRDVPHDGQTVGEIVVRGNVVMKGYYNDPEATATGHPRRLVPHAAMLRSSTPMATSRSAIG